MRDTISHSYKDEVDLREWTPTIVFQSQDLTNVFTRNMARNEKKKMELKLILFELFYSTWSSLHFF